jgi:uncharacterized protein (DUF362 family)
LTTESTTSIFKQDGRFLVGKAKVKTDLKTAILDAVSIIGGFEKVISPGEVVTVKPNLNTADPFPASSDSTFIRILGECLLEAGAGRLQFIESSTLYVNSRKVAINTGLADVAESLDADLVLLDEGAWKKVDIPRGKYLKQGQIGAPLFDIGALILAPNLKTHRLARFTGAMKLLVGWIRPRERIKMHVRRLEEKVADLASYFNPSLVVMDARSCFVTGGPASGRVEHPGVILASGDMVSIDVEGVRILQECSCECDAKNRLDMDVWDLPQIRHAAELGIGATSDEDILVLEVD